MSTKIALDQMQEEYIGLQFGPARDRFTEQFFRNACGGTMPELGVQYAIDREFSDGIDELGITFEMVEQFMAEVKDGTRCERCGRLDEDMNYAHNACSKCMEDVA